MTDKNIVLLRYSLILRPDGQVQSTVENVQPDEFLKTVNQIDKDWDGALKLTQGLKYLLKQVELMDNDFDKYLGSL